LLPGEPVLLASGEVGEAGGHDRVVRHGCPDRPPRRYPQAVASRMASLLDLDPRRILRWLFARAVEASPYWAGMADLARTLYTCLT
jgi:hypothetical protein